MSNAVLAELTEKARKSHSVVLKALSEPGIQVSIADGMSVSESTISRIKNEQAEQFCLFLAHAGLKIVEGFRVCVDPETYRANSHITAKAMANPEIARKLLWDE